MTTVAVHRPVLEWARRRSGRDHSAMRAKFRHWDRWIAGNAHPTFNQAQQFADYTHVPFGMLLLPTPPVEDLPIPDFRVGHAASDEPSQDLLETIYLSQRRQGWYEDYLADLSGGGPLDFVGSALGKSVDEAATMITAALDYGMKPRANLRTIDGARKYLIHWFEEVGGLVVATSMVGNNSHRMLNLDEFRGFTLHSATAPLVFINGHDTKRGQVFSLLHEFAHVWRGDSGVSAGGEPLSAERGEIESWCDHVAAQIAVPANDLRMRYAPSGDLTDELERLADFYKCSTLVVLIRLRDTGLQPLEGFDKLYAEELGRLLAFINERPESTGGTFYNNQPFRIGETLSRALIQDTYGGRTPMTEALSLMSFKSAPVFDKYAESLGQG